MKHDRLHDLKGMPPIPAKHDEKAAFIRQAIRDLSDLIRTPDGGPVIMYPDATDSDICATLHRVALNLKLANTAAADPGELDAARMLRDMAFIEAADALHGDEGTCEIDAPADPRHAPAYVSAADDLEEAGGAYVQAWVWVPLEDVTDAHRASAAAAFDPTPAS